MTGSERRHQLINIARSLFAERGYEGTSIEEVAQRAGVSNRWSTSTSAAKGALRGGRRPGDVGPARRCHLVADQQPLPAPGRAGGAGPALPVEERTDGFRLLLRDSPASVSSGTYLSLINDAVSQVA